MEKELNKIFRRNIEKPEGELAFKIFEEIERRKKNNQLFKKYLFSLIGIVSVASFIPVSKTLLTELSTSGFYEYLTIAFSNQETFFAYWKEILLSLTESLPLASLTYTSILIFIFFLSIKHLLKQTTKSTQYSWS